MENQFNWQAIEKLHAEGNATVESIEAITWPLVVGDDLKATDEQGDLISLLVENDKIVYSHMSNREEWQAGVVHFELPFNGQEVTE